ncbi:Fanconi anemia group C protein isoform X2 [Erythrolamprus reginae]|uniref:Fanconi anemia group C protein isoform X2 n=1 Tax=Erythrolamprus reginae TaxID=121349 RepID=UPI00396C6A62
MEEAMKDDRMVEDSGVSNSSIEFWLNKTLEWDQITTLESQQDVCLHLPELQEFLLQIYGALKHMNSTTAVQKFPLIGQLLGRLCWNPFVIGYDECQKNLICCLCCLYSGEPQNPLELKANSWIQKTLCHLLSFCGLGNHYTDIKKFISTLGFTSVDYYSKLIENKVSSLVMELSRTQVNGFNSQQKKKISLSETAVLQLWLRHLPSLEKAILRNIEQLTSSQTMSMQEMACVIKDSLLHRAACHPAVFRSIDEILKNALLETDGAQEIMTVMQVFTQCFVQAYHENNKQHKFPLKAYFPHNPHTLVRALLKPPSDLPGNSVYQHLEHVAGMLKTTVEIKGSESLDELFNNWFLMIHFGEWADLAAKQLLLSQAESSNLLWLLVFYYSPNNMNRQRTQIMEEARSVCDYLTSLSRMPTISVADLQTLFSSKTSINHSATKPIVMHLIISFVLFTPNGHTIARELIAYILAESDEIPNVTGLLTHISNTASQLGVTYQCSVKLANDLLQEFCCGA